MTKEIILQEILERRVIAVIRIKEEDSLQRVIEAIYAGGISVVEITMTRPLRLWRPRSPSPVGVADHPREHAVRPRCGDRVLRTALLVHLLERGGQGQREGAVGVIHGAVGALVALEAPFAVIHHRFGAFVRQRQAEEARPCPAGAGQRRGCAPPPRYFFHRQPPPHLARHRLDARQRRAVERRDLGPVRPHARPVAGGVGVQPQDVQVAQRHRGCGLGLAVGDLRRHGPQLASRRRPPSPPSTAGTWPPAAHAQQLGLGLRRQKVRRLAQREDLLGRVAPQAHRPADAALHVHRRQVVAGGHGQHLLNLRRQLRS